VATPGQSVANPIRRNGPRAYGARTVDQLSGGTDGARDVAAVQTLLSAAVYATLIVTWGPGARVDA